MNSYPSIVISGIGVVSPIGSGREEFWSALLAGTPGGALISAFEATAYATQIAAECSGFDPLAFMDRKLARRMGRNSQMAVVAAMQAVKDAGLDIAAMDRARIGCLVGSAAGDFNTLEENYDEFRERGAKAISPFTVPKVIPNMPAGNVAIALGINGPNFAPLSACATGAHAIGMALLMLRTGAADVILAGGTESTITPFVLNGYTAMGALSKRNDSPATASRPFDKTRDGFLMGEGAGVVVMETLEHAKARGAEPICEVAGFGATADAFGLAQPDPEATWTTRAMQVALNDAGLSPADVQYVNAHGTSTPANDRSEAMAIRRVFGETLPMVSSIKSMIGHTLGAAGAIETAATALAIRYGIVPPTINYTTPDEEIELDVVPNEARRARVDAALSNSFGFGGQNGVVALKRV